jgi:cysteinyl-tRNA synthetase
MARGLDPLSTPTDVPLREPLPSVRLISAWDALTAADSTLKRWRKKLRDWGASAPTPASNLVISQLVDLILEDLGSADAIIELRRIERDEDIAPGFRAHIFRES